MENIFSDVQTSDTEVSLEQIAEKFGVSVTPENEKLVRAKAESDFFIQSLQRELAEMRQELTKQHTVEEILTQIKTASQPPVQTQPSQEPVKDIKVEVPDIKTLVQQTMAAEQDKSRRSRNETEMTQKLIDVYGADAQNQLNKKARELGVTIEWMREQAQTNPTVFSEIVGLNKKTPQTPSVFAPRTSTNLPPPSSGKRDRAYYEKLKSTNRSEYFSEKVQLQLHKDMADTLRAGNTW